jgi:hypothetical protein
LKDLDDLLARHGVAGHVHVTVNAANVLCIRGNINGEILLSTCSSTSGPSDINEELPVGANREFGSAREAQRNKKKRKKE